MAALRGKRIALLAGILALVALVVAGIATKDRMREEWYLWRLSSKDVETRWRAADVLADMKSARAVPSLLQMLGADRITQHPRRMNGKEVFYMRPVAHAIFRIGPAAVPILAREREKETSLRLARLIDAIEFASRGECEVYVLEFAESRPLGQGEDGFDEQLGTEQAAQGTLAK